jgi:hypothetical protein
MWRPILIAALSAAAVLGPAAASTGAAGTRSPNPCHGPAAKQLLCPRLGVSKPADMYFERRSSGRLLLRATSSLNSLGPGPIELHGTRRGPNSMTATQRIYRRSGGHVKVRTGAHLGFKSIPGQYRYWKLYAAARFELWTVDGSGRAVERVRTGPKLYYCLRDLQRRFPRSRSPRRRHYGACSQSKSRRHVTLGTSVGWSDVYPATYHEQFIDVTGLHGRFRYVIVGDPTGVIYKSNRTAPRASRLVTIP